MAAIRTAPGLAEQVYQAILDEICDGAIAPGAHLVQEQLAERFGVSRQPIQQAMALLKADGMVEEVGKRGLTVVPLDLARMRHHFEIRGVLDGLAARNTARRVKQSPTLRRDIAQRAEKVMADGWKAAEGTSMRELVRADAAFHGLLYEASGNPALAGTAEPLWRHLRRAMSDVMREGQSPGDIWHQHEGILQAVLAGDPDLAEARAVGHLDTAARSLGKDAGGVLAPAAAGGRP